MKVFSRSIVGGQKEIHSELKNITQKHRLHDFLRPIPEYSQIEFKRFLAIYQQTSFKEFILDFGCGTGMSSKILAQRNPNKLVVGIDRSQLRLSKNQNDQGNLLLLRIPIEDFVRLFKKEGLISEESYFLYPNPYPKRKQITKRWYAHPIFPDLLKISRSIIFRSNWKLYLEELAEVLSYDEISSSLTEYLPQEEVMSLFERKYSESGQALYCLRADISKRD